MQNFRNFTLTLVIALLVGASVYFFQEAKFAKLNNSIQIQSIDQPGTSVTLEAGDFKYDNESSSYHGNLQVKGYAEVVEMTVPFCEADCETFEYVFLKVVETANSNIDKFLDVFKGNSFVTEDGIGLGCITDSVLTRTAHSDAKALQSYTHTLADSKQILASNKQNPITLDIERLKSTYGFGAPKCYSHFAEVKIVK